LKGSFVIDTPENILEPIQIHVENKLIIDLFRVAAENIELD